MTNAFSATFESTVDGFSAAGGCTVARNTSDAHAGTGSLLVSITDTSAEVDGSYFSVTAGTSYTLSFWHKLATTGTGSTSAFLFWDSGAGTGDLGSVGPLAFTPGSSWAQQSTSSTAAPTGTTQALVVFGTTSSTSGSAFRIDDVLVATGGGATAPILQPLTNRSRLTRSTLF